MRPAAGLEHLSRDDFRTGGLLHLGQQHRELVAAEARDGVLLPHQRCQPLREAAEQPIGDSVTERLIHVLETIHVDAEQAGGPAGSTAARQRLRQAILEQLPVRQPCGRGSWWVTWNSTACRRSVRRRITVCPVPTPT